MQSPIKIQLILFSLLSVSIYFPNADCHFCFSDSVCLSTFLNAMEAHRHLMIFPPISDSLSRRRRRRRSRRKEEEEEGGGEEEGGEEEENNNTSNKQQQQQRQKKKKKN